VWTISSREIVTCSSPCLPSQQGIIRSGFQKIFPSVRNALEQSHSTVTDQVQSQQTLCTNMSRMCLRGALITFSVSSSWCGMEWFVSSIWIKQLQVSDQYLSTKCHWSTIYAFSEPLLLHRPHQHWWHSYTTSGLEYWDIVWHSAEGWQERYRCQSWLSRSSLSASNLVAHIFSPRHPVECLEPMGMHLWGVDNGDDVPETCPALDFRGYSQDLASSVDLL